MIRSTSFRLSDAAIVALRAAAESEGRSSTNYLERLLVALHPVKREKEYARAGRTGEKA